jgi:hypothetical protein
MLAYMHGTQVFSDARSMDSVLCWIEFQSIL